MTTWLITREAVDAAVERSLLESHGLAAIELPCVATELRDWPWRDEPQGFTFFTSRRAVQAWVNANKPPLGAIAALSPATHDALEQQGVTPQLTASGGAVGLAKALRARTDAPVRYPTSSAGLRSKEQAEALRVLGPLSVDRRVVYDVSPPPGLGDAIALATRFQWSVLFSSPSAVLHFLEACAEARAPVRAVCFGVSTARTWDERRPAHWPHALASTDLATTLLEIRT